MSDADFYAVLGVDRDASGEEIRRAYRRLARAFHPDIAGPAGAPRFDQATVAYEVLADPAQRREYDAWIDAATVTRPPSPLTAPGQRRNRELAPRLILLTVLGAFAAVCLGLAVGGGLGAALVNLGGHVLVVFMALVAVAVFTPIGPLFLVVVAARRRGRR